MTLPVPTLPAPNIPLLRKAVEWAEAEAQKPAAQRLWNQGNWAQDTDCGTAYCIAGFAVITALPGAEVVQGDCCPHCKKLHVDGERVPWHDAGRQSLGLTEGEASDLFDPDNGIREVRQTAERIAARAGERL